MSVLRSKLAAVAFELNDLDHEIDDINAQLSEPSSASSGRSIEVTSPSLLSVDSPSAPPSEAACAFPGRRPHIDGYRPPEDRILETRERRLERVAALKSESDRQFREIHPFAPVLETAHAHTPYDPNHLLRPRRLPQEEVPKAAPKAAPRADTLFARQQRAKARVEEAPPARKFLSPDAERDLVNRLARPRRIARPEEAAESSGAVASQKTIDRLVKGSIRKAVRSSEPAPALPRYITKVSEHLTHGVQRNLYEESLQAHARKSERVQRAVQQCEQLQAMTAQQGRREAKKWQAIDTSRPCDIAGADLHVDRMKKSRAVATEEEQIEVPTALVIRPFAFDVREGKKEQNLGIMQEAVLREISEILRAQ
jgi:hypothetical protein